MKINWGTGIVLAFIFFISFILYFVISMTVNKKYEHDLVVENYYNQELEFENDMSKQKNAQLLSEDISWKRIPEGLLLSFPKDMEPSKITGRVFLYRPSNKQLDFEKEISLSEHNLLIPDKSLLGGRWNIKVDWAYNDDLYLYKKDIVY
ncbi:FixH family protein [Gelidibacter maritimus]|uniref:FixH family protein n=1 Tax=Gelidibacter maritimus TaxID=2761487 RepID=A0A7W2M207_9FLAO|nr:FixH family protein [Gelidibacter maritimus]MBA6151238.1 FixH family protein [Gelidibacter maritimus]